MPSRPTLLAYESLPVNDLVTLIVTVSIARTGKVIGTIHWARDWRQYAYTPAPGTSYTRGVLIELRAKLGRLMRDWAKRQPQPITKGAPRRDNDHA